MSKTDSTVTTLDDAAPVATAALNTAKKRTTTTAGSQDGTAIEDVSGQMVNITIHSASGDDGGDAVFASLNGYAYQIPRDKPVPVPAEVAQVISDAKQTSHHRGPNGAVIEKTVPRFAFSIAAIPA